MAHLRFRARAPKYELFKLGDTRTLATVVTEEMYNDLAEFSLITRTSMSAIMREALHDYLYGAHCCKPSPR